jgi:hypothetical protein
MPSDLIADGRFQGRQEIGREGRPRTLSCHLPDENTELREDNRDVLSAVFNGGSGVRD